MTKLAPEWLRTKDPVIRSPARYRWTTAPANSVTKQWFRVVDVIIDRVNTVALHSAVFANNPENIPLSVSQLLLIMNGPISIMISI